MVNAMKKIFVADDDTDILDIIKLMLDTQGYNTQVATNANDIFSLSEEQLPDLILLDIWMSGVDGRDICNRLQQSEVTKHIPVLFISANSDIEAITTNCNATGFIAKPFDMNVLLDKVKETLEMSSVE